MDPTMRACTGCADQTLAGTPCEGPRKRRRILRMGILPDDVILPEKAPPVDDTQYDSEEETDGTTSSTSSTDEDTDYEKSFEDVETATRHAAMMLLHWARRNI